MPHSSGGGSHGGGFHGGSGFSSSGSSNSVPRRSRTYFTGCRTYVYYRHGRPYYLYSDSDLRNDTGARIAGALIVLLFIVVFGFVIYSTGFKTPKKLEGTSDYAIVVKDNANVLEENSQELTDALKEFKDLTGIVPAIFTVYNEDWSRYISLETYAYDLYVNNFIDEKHWLIVYSVPSGEDKFDWSWEAMQGDDTDDILTEGKCDDYIEIIHNNLSRDSIYTDTQALAKSFAEINETVMEKGGASQETVILIVVEIALVLVLFGIIFSDKLRGYKTSDLKEVKENVDKTTGKAKEANCEYCGGLYVVGMHDSCPHCGARVLAQDYQPEQEKKDDDFTIDSSKY